MTESRATTCCIAGGGPAGMMLGFLLARAGVEVIVLEKHADFFRDFRGDTIHPSTQEIMNDLGLLDEFLELPHNELHELVGDVDGRPYRLVDFRRLPTRSKFMAMMPQWDFLNFLARKASAYPAFNLALETEATGLIQAGGKVTGITARTPAGPVEITADLVVVAAGRNSSLKDAVGLEADGFGVPFDVTWFRLSKHTDALPSLGRVGDGHLLITIDRGEYWQAGLLIQKGSFDTIKAEGLEAFRAQIVRIAPFLEASVGDLDHWEDVKLLSVQVDRLRRWYRPGLLCIGDSAHAMSPAGGVGVNFAVADAVAAANQLAGPLARHGLTDDDLAAVQERREPPVRRMQSVQVRQGALFGNVGSPWTRRVFKLMSIAPPLRHLMGRAVGLGFRPERPTTPDVGAVPRS